MFLKKNYCLHEKQYKNGLILLMQTYKYCNFRDSLMEHELYTLEMLKIFHRNISIIYILRYFQLKLF
uniref:Uncharacterized protein n=1 Tax=Heterorhabditis bacteriophora TaxID=37862 RepID=A0A1I7WJJ7_HETBA